MQNVASVVLLMSALTVGVAAASPQAGTSNPVGQDGAVAPPPTTVTLAAVEFGGNDSIKSDRLRAVLADATGQALTFSALQALADRVTQFYRSQGFPIARAILPAQTIRGGVVRIDVLEGRFGRVAFANHSRLSAEVARSFFGAIKPGDVIRSGAIDRATLLLSDLPGVDARTELVTGAQSGTADLVVHVEDQGLRSGRLTLDNGGGPATGVLRPGLEASWSDVFGVGGRLSLNAGGFSSRQWNGRVGYQLPVGGAGLSVEAAVSTVRTAFGAASVTGRTDDFTLRARDAVVRSERLNVTADATLDVKGMHDQYGAGLAESRQLTGAGLGVTVSQQHGALQLQNRLTTTFGRLTLDSPVARAADQATAQTAGDFTRVNLNTDLDWFLGGGDVRLVLSAQAASKNLDSTEKMGLGGASGVRAYPAGTASGDQGALMRLSWNHALATGRLPGRLGLSLFWDGGIVQTNKRPWPGSGTPNEQIRTGAGAAVNWSDGPLIIDVFAAHPIGPQAPRTSRLGFNAAWQF